MGRAPCGGKNGLKKGQWTPEEDQKLIVHIQKHCCGNWRTLPKNAGLQRCGKSCHLHLLVGESAVKVQNFLSSMPYHIVFGFLIPLLVAVLQVRVQGTTKSLFETYPANLWTFLLATIIYCFALAADIKSKLLQASNPHNTSYYQLFGAVAFSAGSLSSVSLVSMILPCSHAYLIYIPWAFVSIFIAYQHATSIKDIYDWLYQKIHEKISSLKEQHPPV